MWLMHAFKNQRKTAGVDSHERHRQMQCSRHFTEIASQFICLAHKKDSQWVCQANREFVRPRIHADVHNSSGAAIAVSHIRFTMAESRQQFYESFTRHTGRLAMISSSNFSWCRPVILAQCTRRIFMQFSTKAKVQLFMAKLDRVWSFYPRLDLVSSFIYSFLVNADHPTVAINFNLLHDVRIRIEGFLLKLNFIGK